MIAIVDTAILRETARMWRVYGAGVTSRAITGAADEIDRLRALADDLWDEVMAWHFDECPFPTSPMGTPDAQCICHRDLLFTYSSDGAR